MVTTATAARTTITAATALVLLLLAGCSSLHDERYSWCQAQDCRPAPVVAARGRSFGICVFMMVISFLLSKPNYHATRTPAWPEKPSRPPPPSARWYCSPP